MSENMKSVIVTENLYCVSSDIDSVEIEFDSKLMNKLKEDLVHLNANARRKVVMTELESLFNFVNILNTRGENIVNEFTIISSVYLDHEGNVKMTIDNRFNGWCQLEVQFNIG